MRKGSHHTAETRSKISAKVSTSLRGNQRSLGYRHTAEARANMSAGQRGRVHSAETRAKQTGRPPTHGLHGSPEYWAWTNARKRCYDPNISFKYYGEMGVRMCDEWLNDPVAFIGYVGPRPSPLHSLDRIDPWGDYEPGNVRWATKSEQARNQRANFNRDMHFTGRGLINAILHPLL